MDRLKGKVAFITGGARGQGRAIAQKFATEGADIVIADICQDIPTVGYHLGTEEDLRETQQSVEAFDRRCLAEIADVRDQAAMDAVVARGIETFGKIDIVIAQAGIADYKPLWEITEDEWQDAIDVNLTGAWHTLKAVAPHLIERGTGTVVFTSSVNGIEGGWNYAHYIAAKHGVLGLMKSAALELGPYDIRVNAVLPGPIDTKINDYPRGRDRIVGHPDATREEYLKSVKYWHALKGRTALPASAIADAMIWLVSDEASNVTGIELIIDAGHNILPGVNPRPFLD
jgi:SDR family mycofactocin-dependent oxidoreductase